MSTEVAEDRLVAARSFYRAGNFAAAERMIREALAEDPELPAAHAFLSLALYRQSKGAPALEAAQAAIALSPDAYAFRVKALALLLLGRKTQMLEAARAAVALDPTDQRAILVLANALERTRKLKEAEAAFRRAAEIVPDDIEGRADLGCFLLRQDRLAEAEAEAATLDPASEDESARLLRGEIALMRGRPDEARDFALWILSTDATNESALRLLALVKASQSAPLRFWWRYTLFISARTKMFRRFIAVPVAVLLTILFPFPMIPLWIYFRFSELLFLQKVRRERQGLTFKKSF